MWNPFIHIKTALKLIKTLFTHYYSALFILPHWFGAILTINTDFYVSTATEQLLNQLHHNS